jgi:hypothetical protein
LRSKSGEAAATNRALVYVPGEPARYGALLGK